MNFVLAVALLLLVPCTFTIVEGMSGIFKVDTVGMMSSR